MQRGENLFSRAEAFDSYAGRFEQIAESFAYRRIIVNEVYRLNQRLECRIGHAVVLRVK
jgi:hypothetical protein